TSYISVNKLIEQKTMASEYVSVGHYVNTVLEGGSYKKNRITPPVLIKMLEKDNLEALQLVKNINATHNTSLMYEVADIKTWANLGLHLAEKLKGAVALQTYRLSGGEDNKKKAIEHLQKALEYWDEVIRITRPIYKDMRLT